jgi:hypothetical protein
MRVVQGTFGAPIACQRIFHAADVVLPAADRR